LFERPAPLRSLCTPATPGAGGCLGPTLEPLGEPRTGDSSALVRLAHDRGEYLCPRQVANTLRVRVSLRTLRGGPGRWTRRRCPAPTRE
jgi:hypothetical protein